MKLMCNAYFTAISNRIATGYFDVTVPGYVAMAEFIHRSMARGADRAIISDGVVFLEIETSPEWLDKVGTEMVRRLAERFAEAVIEDRQSQTTFIKAVLRDSEASKNVESTT
jgi:hypothetical protein